MTADKLKKVALTQFGLHGYDGASLSLIATEVGMKKQSIYAHFKSKEDLFLSTYSDSIALEFDFIHRFIEEHQSDSLKDLLHGFLRRSLERYTESNNTSFFLRTSFFPPLQLEQLVKDGTNVYVAELEAIFLKVFHEKQETLREGLSAESASLSFLTMMDGLLVEMLYGIPERLEKRTAASWNVYFLAISRPEEENSHES